MAFQVTEVQKALKGADYPMDGKALSALAKKNGADSDLIDALKGLREVDGPNTVMKELKGSLGGSTPGGNSSAEKTYKNVKGPSLQERGFPDPQPRGQRGRWRSASAIARDNATP